jgi:hypothetical protein
MTGLVRVGLTGGFVDAFIYRTQLYVVTLKGELRVYEVSDIEDRLAEEAGRLGNAISYTMFHSRGLGAAPRQKDATSTFRGRVARDEIKSVLWLDGESLPYRSGNLGVPGHAVLDVLIYIDRLYLATEDGLLATDTHSQIEDLGLRSLLPYRCLSAKVSLGAVAASCGEEGLNILFDDFAWLGKRGRKEVADSFSLRAAYAGLGLVNYTSQAEFRFLEGRYEQLGADNASRAFVDFKRTGLAQALFQRLTEAAQAEEDEFEYTFNRGPTFFAFLHGKVYRAFIRTVGEQQQRRVTWPRLQATYQGRVVEAQVFGDHILVETLGSVIFVPREGKPTNAYRGPVVSLRAFPRSKRYQALATLVAEKGLVLLAGTPAEADSQD